MNTRFVSIIFAISLLSCWGLALAVESPRELVVAGMEENSSGVDGRRLAELIHEKKDLMLRHRIVRIDPAALNTDHRIIPSEKGDDFEWCIGEQALLTLFGNETMVIRNRYVDEHGTRQNFNDVWTWAGIVEGDDTSTAIFIIADGIISSGEISSPVMGEFQIEHINGDFYLVFERNQKHFENLDPETLHEASDDMKGEPEEFIPDDGQDDLQNLSFLTAEAQSGSNQTIRVNGFATGAFPGGGNQAFSNLILGIARANLALATGESSDSFLMVGNVFDVFTVNEKDFFGNSNVGQLLDRITLDGNPAVTALRNAVGADLMIGFAKRDFGSCGAASQYS